MKVIDGIERGEETRFALFSLQMKIDRRISRFSERNFLYKGVWGLILVLDLCLGLVSSITQAYVLQHSGCGSNELD